MPRRKRKGTKSGAHYLKDLGNHCHLAGKHIQAIAHYTEAIKLSPNYKLFSNRCASYLKLKYYVKALEDANASLTLEPHWCKAYMRRGLAYEGLHRYEDALNAYKKGLKLEPQNKELKEKYLELKEQMAFMDLNNDLIAGGTHSQTASLKRMLIWLKKGGSKFPKLYFKCPMQGYRSIHTVRDISLEEIIMYIPHNLIITSDVAKVSRIGQSILKTRIELRSKHSLLAAYLLSERAKGQKSQWFPYLDVLPKTFNTIPIFFETKYLEMLKGSLSLQKIRDRTESLRIEYENLYHKVPEFRRFSHEDFVWARLIVITRIFGLIIGGVKTDGLVPMADMLNHKRPRETKWSYDEKACGFVINALNAISKNGEVFDSYGRKCNSRFFVNYGFALEDNDDNEGLVSLDLLKEDSLYHVKLKFMSSGLSRRDFQLPRFYKEKKAKECFAFLRFIAATQEELVAFETLEGQRFDDIPPISRGNERRSLIELRKACLRALSRFDTTLEDDLTLLRDEVRYPPFSNERNCIIMRAGEKRVLTHYVNLANLCVDHFLGPDVNWRSMKALINKRFRSQENPIAEYIHAVIVPLMKRGS